MKTVVSHFYNEEYLLPHWLLHHKRIFDHGIMIDYHSTDASCDIIREVCPTWQIVSTANRHFESAAIDQEVIEYERGIEGWRMCLNTTEFLYGHHQQLDLITYPTQVLVGNYIFTGGSDLNVCEPLHLQHHMGYYQGSEGSVSLHLGSRALRSMHNYPVVYTPGRHWDRGTATYSDLAIFYYGYANTSEQMLARKLQIKAKMPPSESSLASHPNTVCRQQYLNNIHSHQQNSRDLTTVVYNLAKYNYSLD